MTMVRVSHLKCDECSTAGPFGDGHDARVQAERDGWQVRVGVRRWQVGKDLCPACKATPPIVQPCADCRCALADHHKLRCENEDCPGGCNGWRCPEHGWVLCGCTYAGGVDPKSGDYPQPGESSTTTHERP